MATTDLTSKFTLLDVQKMTDPKGRLTKVATILTQSNDPLKDATWEMCNNGNVHEYGEETYLGEAYYGAINEGWGEGKSETEQRIARASEYVLDSRVDIKLIKGNAIGQQTRHFKDKRIIEGIGQQMQYDMLYGDGLGKHPEGLFTKFNSLSLPNVINNGGSGTDLRSLFIVQWGIDKVTLLYPEGTTAGLMMEDQGIKDVWNGDLRMEKYVTKFQAHMGVAVKDARCFQRIVNIEPQGDNYSLNAAKIVEALNNMPERGKGAVIYCDRSLMTQFDILAMEKNNVTYESDEVWGGKVAHFQGTPVRMCEQLVDESTIS